MQESHTGTSLSQLKAFNIFKDEIDSVLVNISKSSLDVGSFSHSQLFCKNMFAVRSLDLRLTEFGMVILLLRQVG